MTVERRTGLRRSFLERMAAICCCCCDFVVAFMVVNAQIEKKSPAMQCLACSGSDNEDEPILLIAAC